MRIGLAEILQESNTFSPIRCTLAHFEQGGIYYGAEILTKMRGIGAIGGFLIAVEEEAAGSFELVPVMRATAMGGGILTADTLDYLEEHFASELKKAGPLDALFLSMHGAGASEKVDSIEGHLLGIARQIVGDRTRIVVPLDHHANITRRMVECADALVGYQTEPHDFFETGTRAARLLFAMLKGKGSPRLACHKIPMLAPADRMPTAHGPMKELFDLARQMEKRPGVLSVSPFPVQPWLDVAELGWAAVAIADGDDGLAQALAVELAEKAWALRGEFWVVNRLSPAEIVSRVAAAPAGPIIVSDSCDSVLAGAPGDSTWLLKELVERRVPYAVLLPMVDAEAVDAALKAGVGNEITLPVGGKLDHIYSQPVVVTGRVVAAAESLISHTHFGSFDLGRTVHLQVGQIHMIVSEEHGVGAIQPDMYRHFGLEPAEAKMVAVKTSTNFQYYGSMLKGILWVDCPGVADWDLRRFTWKKAPRPLYPLDDLQEWHAGIATQTTGRRMQ